MERKQIIVIEVWSKWKFNKWDKQGPDPPTHLNMDKSIFFCFFIEPFPKQWWASTFTWYGINWEKTYQSESSSSTGCPRITPVKKKLSTSLPCVFMGHLVYKPLDYFVIPEGRVYPAVCIHYILGYFLHYAVNRVTNVLFRCHHGTCSYQDNKCRLAVKLTKIFFSTFHIFPCTL